MKNYLKSLFSMSLLVLNAADKDNQTEKTDKHCSYLFAGGIGATYYFSVGETFKVGPSASVLYAYNQGVKGFLGVDAKIGMEMSFIKGFHLSANLMVAGRAPQLKLDQSSFNEKQKELAKKLEEETKPSMSGFLNGFNFMVGVDVPYAFVGIYAEYASAHSLLKKNASVGLVVAPTLAVPGMDNLEVRAFLIAAKSFGKRELKRGQEDLKKLSEGFAPGDQSVVFAAASGSDYYKAVNEAMRFVPETEKEQKDRQAMNKALAEKAAADKKAAETKKDADKKDADKAETIAPAETKKDNK